MLEFTKYFNLDDIWAVRKISAAVVNISGRQRMLSQRTAFLSLQLVCSQVATERVNLRAHLLDAINLMEKSHSGLINGDRSMNLPGQTSKEVTAMYFQSPLNLDKQVRDYIAEVRALVQSPDAELEQNNPHLNYITTTAYSQLLEALDAVVTQYQQESEAELLEMDLKHLKLYQETCAAATQAEDQAAELEKALIELKQAQAKLLHSEKMSSLGQLVASVAHEINNPVSFIYGNLSHAEVYTQDLLHLLNLYHEYYPKPISEIQDHIQNIDLDFLIEDLPKVLCSMQIGADRIRQIVMSLRNFSRTDDTEMKQVDLHEGIDTTLLILQNRLRAHPKRPTIEIVKDYADLPMVTCYAGQLNQVFMNILSNAIDALEEGMGNREEIAGEILPTIRIRTEVTHPDYVTVRISDNGPGIPLEVKSRVFDQFFTTKQVGKGTGLGLSISRKILVENHQGSIRCESQPGEGTEFWIEIPVQSTQEQSAVKQKSKALNS
ncbi:ATP-binding protein [Kamptonema sp. UHCC 0994]|uniref:ATP-binding protein n=1 Tax=Kamptonema sp. UHCC 0994 TaxID=3031329 RepID=UPI0023BAD0FC|nr:ATP-binding protein [Kamptonema sp. UHCC 0994]MDF0556532.1 ATP-binding protein [Kamptonema sp. UHCC 0994]